MYSIKYCRFLGIFIGVMCCVLLLHLDVEAKDLQELKISYPESNAQYWTMNVARDKGFFEGEGFTTANFTVPSSSASIQLIVSREAHIVQPQPDAMFIAFSKGAKDLAILGQPLLKPDWLLVTGSTISSWSDLKGKKVGLSALHGSEFYLIRMLLAKNNLPPTAWIPFQVGLTAAKLTALQKGTIDAATLYQPAAQRALKENYKMLADFSKLDNYPPCYYLVNRKWAAENENGIRFARVIKRATEWLWNPTNRDEAIAIHQKYTKAAPDILQKVYDQYFITGKIHTRDSSVDMEGLNNVFRILADNGDLPKDSFRPEEMLLPKNIGGIY
jgi:ABC-type nitrate/sulfonate/bicarbonate transport system substrate-binding protein